MRSNSISSVRKPGSFTENARREQIIGGAIAILARNGFAETSLSAIGEHLGMSKGLISYHFSGKADLLNGVVLSVLEQAEAWMSPRVVKAGSFTEALRLYISSNLAFLDAHRAETAALTELLSNARSTPGIAETFRKTQQEAIAGLESLFTGGRASGEFGDISPHVAAVSLRAAIDAVTGMIREDPDFDLVKFETDLTALYQRASAS